MNMKHCTKCKENKNLSYFCKNVSTKDGTNYVCKECDNKRRIEYFSKNRLAETEKQSVRNKNNPEKRREYQRKYSKTRRNSDLNYRLKIYLRNRMGAAIKLGYKSGSAVDDLGCSVEFLKQHLQTRFKPGMTWDNYGEWHIDHILPLSKFDLSKRQQFLIACNYNNLQPLWADENMRKSDN
jgi:hypothetical protein